MRQLTLHAPPLDYTSAPFVLTLTPLTVTGVIEALNRLCITLEESGYTGHVAKLLQITELLHGYPRNARAIRRAWASFRLPPMADEASIDYGEANRALRSFLPN